MRNKLTFWIAMGVGSAFMLVGCSTKPVLKPDLTPSAEHLTTASPQSHRAEDLATSRPSAPAETLASTVAPTNKSLISIPATTVPTTEPSSYRLQLSNAPMRRVLQKLGTDAHVALNIDRRVSGAISLNLHTPNATEALRQFCAQADLILEPQPNRTGNVSYQVRVDSPYWKNHTLDYLNVERQVSSSLMVANALGSITGRTAQAVTLGGQNTAPVAVNQGSSTALLNQSKYDLWNNLQQGVTRLIRAHHPELLLNTATTQSTTTQTAVTTGTGTAESPTTATTPDQAAVNPATNTPAEPPDDIPKAGDYAVYPLGTQAQELIHLNREGGFISVFAPQRTQNAIAELIEQTQASIARQVLIEATILEVELNDEHQSGVNWQALVDGQGLSIVSAFTGRDQIDFTSSQSAGLVTMTGSAISKDFSLSSTLKLLERYGQSRVLSSPKLMTMNHQPSLIKVVKNLVYFTMQAQVIAGQTGQASTRAYVSTPNTVPVGLIMSVIPAVSAHQRITLAVRPTISSLSGVVDDPNPDLGEIPNRVPIIQERELESVLTLEDGQIAILGGLIQDVVAEEDTGIPSLVSAPQIGFLFGQKNQAKRKSELVIFLKPTLISSQIARQK